MQAEVPESYTTARKFTACDACYRRKIKCDGVHPRCNWCFHQDSKCTYVRPSPRRVTKRGLARSTGAKRVSLRERIQRLDERRADAMPILNINAAQAQAPNLLPEGLRWIKSRTGVIISLSTSYHAPWEKPLSSIDESGPSGIGSTLELPKKPALEQCLDLHLSSPMHKIFPVIDSSLFSSTIQAAYPTRGSAPRTQNHSSRACVFAFMAFVSCLGELDTPSSAAPPLSIPCKEYIKQARSLLSSIIQEPLNLDALQTALLLALIYALTGEAQTAVYYVSLAARFIIASGAHTMTDNPDSTCRSILEQHLRTLFWVCYALDKDLALRTGQAHVLKDDDCDLDLPLGYPEHLHSFLDHSPGTETDIRGPIFPFDLRLSMIKSRAFTTLYSHSGLRKTDTELIRSIRELDEELECWRMSLHQHLRPQLAFAPKHEKPKNTFLILTHMNYYSCVNLIHLASSRCSAWRSPSGEGGALIRGLQSSLTLSVEASRSLLLYLQEFESQNPVAESARSDVQLLALAEQTTARLFLRRGNPLDRVIDLQPISDFISKLREHAHQVIRRNLIGTTASLH
ncbi:hypothetical protein BDW69DRAFT_193743 [Aspergillus filifer]